MSTRLSAVTSGIAGFRRKRTETVREKASVADGGATNGICARFHKTILNEFYQVAFRKRIYATLEELQGDLTRGSGAWLPSRLHRIAKYGPTRALERGDTGKTLSATFASQMIRWKGRVAAVELYEDVIPGLRLRIEELRHALNNGCTLVGRHLFLSVDDDAQRRQLAHLRPGDLIYFSSMIAPQGPVFHPVEVSMSADEKTLYLEIEMRGADLLSEE